MFYSRGVNGSMQHSRAVLCLVIFTLIASMVPFAEASTPWANDNLNYRVPLTVNAGTLARVNCPVNASVDFADYTQLLVDKSSIRLFTSDGAEVPSQLQWLSDSNCTIYFRVTIPANAQATYHVYFAAGKALTAANYTSDLTVTTAASTTIQNSKYQIQWDSKTNAKGIFIKNYSSTTNLYKYIDDQQHSLFYTYVEPHNFFHLSYPHSTTETNDTYNIAQVLTNGPEVVVMRLLQRSFYDAERDMTLYFYPSQNYFVVDEKATYDAYSGDGYLALRWSILLDCGSAPTSYADTEGHYYTAENPNNYGLGLVWLTKDPHLTWKNFNAGELNFNLPDYGSYNDEDQHSVYAIVLDGKSIRDTTGNVYAMLTNPPTVQVSAAAETPTAGLSISAPAAVTAKPNQATSFDITIQNTGSAAAINVHLSASAVPASWIQFSDDYFTLDSNSQKSVTVTVNPATSTDAVYNLTISASTATLPAQNAIVALTVSNTATPQPSSTASTGTATTNPQTGTQNLTPIIIAVGAVVAAVIAVLVVLLVKKRRVSSLPHQTG